MYILDVDTISLEHRVDGDGEAYFLRPQKKRSGPSVEIHGRPDAAFEQGCGSWLIVQDNAFIDDLGMYSWEGTYSLADAKKVVITLGRLHPDVLSGKQPLGAEIAAAKDFHVRIYPDHGYLKMPDFSNLTLRQMTAIAEAPRFHYDAVMAATAKPKIS